MELREGMEQKEKTLLNKEHMEELQNKFCKAHHVYCACLDENAHIVAENYGQVTEWGSIGEYVRAEVCRDLLKRLKESTVEEVIEAELPVEYMKICGVSIRMKHKVAVNWIIGAVLEDKIPKGVEIPKGIERTTTQGFEDALEFLCIMFHHYFALQIGEMTASEESRKSRMAEKRMEEELKRSEAMTEVVQMLESEQDFPTVVEQVFRHAGTYLNIGSACLMQLERSDDTVSIISEWNEDNVLPQKPLHQKRSVGEYPFMNGKPYVISSDTPLNAEFKYYFSSQNIKAAIFLPIEVNGQVVMYLAFLEHTLPREWEIAQIKFAHDVKRILQSILTKRITKNSLAGSYASLEEILDNIGCGICVRALEEEKVFFTNEKFRILFRRTMLEGKLDQVLPNNMESRETGEIYVEDEDRWFDIHRTEIVWVDGKTVALYTVYDITENKKYQKRIEKQANNDFLTGLYNRMRCEEDLEKFIAQTKENGGEGALLYMDLDDFKHINDGLGHQYGDVLLKAISHSLQRISGIEDTCYRMGGDEFIIVVCHTKYWMLGKIIEEIRDIFSKPWFLKGADYYCTVSIGIVRFPADGDNVQDLVRKADLALFEAKKGGKNRFEFYGEGVDSSSFKRLDLEKNMRNATMNACTEFEVYYQPIIDISRDGNPCTGAEALIRWNCQNLGFISPSEFIPLAEYLGLINPIGDYVLMEACRHCKYWNDMGHSEYKVNVNLSVVQLLRNDMVDRVKEVLEETRMNPQNLTLEVTESLAINDMARMQAVLEKIKELGVRVALDDFGTGYSSLNHIREMPIDVIKIDRCFIVDLGIEQYADAFVKIVCELAATIGMNVCVEGVETQQQYEILKKMQIQMIQGFYFDRPMKLEDFEKKYV